MKRFIALSSLLMLSLTACGKSSSSEDNSPSVSADAGSVVQTPTAPASPVAGSAEVVNPVVDAEAVLVSLQIDATDKLNFAHLDLDTGKIVEASDGSWDLAFKRTVIKQNSDVKTAVVQDSSFDAIVAAPPTASFEADAPAPAAVETAGLVFHAGPSWYSYDMSVHVINSNNFVYFVKSNSAAEYKLSIKDYYDADRLPAFIQIQFIKVIAAQGSSVAAE